MPRIVRTILPKIRKSLRQHGVLRTAWSCFAGPYQLLQHYRQTQRDYRIHHFHDEFDRMHKVETAKRVHLTDLHIESPNWIYADGYWPTPPDLVREALSSLEMRHERFTFIDLGSGKGRVLLLASEYPFRRILGVEFSPELHAIAQENIRRYQSSTQKCRDITSCCMDFTAFRFPDEPLFVFLYNPSSREITSAVASNLAQSIRHSPRPLWVMYVTPAYDVFASGGPLGLRQVKKKDRYALYSNCDEQPFGPESTTSVGLA